MKIVPPTVAAAFLSLLLCPAPVPARQTKAPPAGERCDGQVFLPSEVTRKARVKHNPVPGFTDEARANDIQGTIRLRAVLCRTGRVTDIEVVQGLSHGMTELAVEAARGIKFEPALKDGRRVSQTINLEYHSHLAGSRTQPDEDLAKGAGRLVEQLIIDGNRRLTDSQIIANLLTREGERYKETTVRRDLQALLELGTLDKTQTRVSIETGPRGGVVVIFSVFELPVIRTIAFRGLKSVSESEALAALAARRPGLKREGVFDPAHMPAARHAILELLAARGRKEATVELFVEEVSAVSVSLVFQVNERPDARTDSAPGRWF